MKGFRTIPLLAVLTLPAVAADHKVPPVQPATSFAAVEVHDKEKVAIAAEPTTRARRRTSFAWII